MTAKILETPEKKTILMTSTTNKKKLDIQMKQSKGICLADLSGISPIKTPASRRKVEFSKQPPASHRRTSMQQAAARRRPVCQSASKRRTGGQMNSSKTGDEHREGGQDGGASQYRKRITQLESKLRRHELEAKSHKSRIQAMSKQIQEKDKIIRNLELKLPKVLADVRRGMQTREIKIPWREKRDLATKQTPGIGDQLLRKIDECERLTQEIKHLRDETKLMDNIIRSNQCELEAERTRVARLEEQLMSVQGRFSAMVKECERREDYLQEENDYLYNEIRVQYDALLETEEEIRKMEDFVTTLISKIPELQEISIEDSLTKKDASLENIERTQISNSSRQEGDIPGNITWPARSRRRWKLPKVSVLAELFHPRVDEVNMSGEELINTASVEADNEKEEKLQEGDSKSPDNEKDTQEALDDHDKTEGDMSQDDCDQSRSRFLAGMEDSVCLINFTQTPRSCWNFKKDPNFVFQPMTTTNLIDQSDVESNLLDNQSDIAAGLADKSDLEAGLVEHGDEDLKPVDESDGDVVLEFNGTSDEENSDWNSSDEFENSEDKSQFCTRLENLDLQLEILLNKLNTTANKSTF